MIDLSHKKSYQFHRKIQTNNWDNKENIIGKLPRHFPVISQTSGNVVCTISSCQLKPIQGNRKNPWYKLPTQKQRDKWQKPMLHAAEGEPKCVRIPKCKGNMPRQWAAKAVLSRVFCGGVPEETSQQLVRVQELCVLTDWIHNHISAYPLRHFRAAKGLPWSQSFPPLCMCGTCIQSDRKPDFLRVCNE